jgi:hypothetical protein
MGVNSTDVYVYENPDIEPTSPPPSYPGDSIIISFNITFGNGTPMTGLNISANSPTARIPLYEVSPGIYNGTYIPGIGDIGRWNITVNVNGNTLNTGMSVLVNLLSLESLLIIVILVVISLAIIIIKVHGV